MMINMKTKWITSEKTQLNYLIDANDKYMERCLQQSGYQIKNWHFAKSLCDPNGIAIDCGASIGMNSINYSDYFNSVEAFEPDPDIYECLLKTLSANNIDNVYTHCVAISDKNQKGTLVKFPRATFANTLKPIKYVGRSRPQLEIDITTIDSYQFQNVKFLKIDVEGWELNVLKGAEQTIKKYKPVIQVEIKPQLLLRSGTKPQDIFIWLFNIGYHAKHFRGDITELEYFENKILTKGISDNLVDFWFICL